MLDLFSLFVEIRHAFETGNKFFILESYCIVILAIVLKYKYVRLPYVKSKFILWSLFGFSIIALWNIGLLNGFRFYLSIIIEFPILPIVLIYSCGNLIFPCSLIDCKVSNFLKDNEPEKAEKILRYYRWFSLDSTGKYSYYFKKAETSAAKGNLCNSIKVLLKIDTKKLNENQNLRLELSKAYYYAQLGDFDRAKQTVKQLSKTCEISGEYLIQLYLIQALYTEAEGDLQKSSELLKKAINVCTNDTNIYCQVALNNMGRIRRIEKNYTDSYYYYQRHLKAIKNLRNRTLIHTAYRNVIKSLVLDNKSEDEVKYIQEYQSFIDLKNLNDLMEYYNFRIRYFRQKSDKYNLSKTLEEAEEKTCSMMSRKEQLVSDISLLRIKWNNELSYLAVLDKIESQYSEYSNFSQMEKFYCYIEIDFVLQALRDKGMLGTHKDMYYTNKVNIRVLLPELKEHPYNIPEYCVSERCTTMWNIVRANKCNSDYDKDEVLRVLKDIKDIYSKNGNFVEAFKIGLDICDEALFQQKREEMWKFTKLAMNEVKRLYGHPEVTPAYIRIACFAYNAGEIGISRDYVELYEETGSNILHYADWIQSIYKELKTCVM